MLVSQILSTTCFFLFVPVQFYSKIDSLFYHAPKSAKGIAKVMRFYDMTKFLFKNFSHLSSRRCGTHCLESGCKDRTFSHHNQTFRQLFFMFFLELYFFAVIQTYTEWDFSEKGTAPKEKRLFYGNPDRFSGRPRRQKAGRFGRFSKKDGGK